jgi:hypothetical protein
MPQGRSKRRTLRDLSRARRTFGEDVDAFQKEIKDGSDRTCCILMAAVVERTLERCILLRLGIHDEEKINPLFERDGALSTFYGTIHLAYAIGLINHDIRDDLNTIRQIRNAFAHSELVLDFKVPEVSTALKKLRVHTFSELKDPSLFASGNARVAFVGCCVSINGVLTDTLDTFTSTSS